MTVPGYRAWLAALMLGVALPASAADAPLPVERFARLALTCLRHEFRQALSVAVAHVLASDADVAPPRELTPVFFGCYDWHSAVHAHWLLVRLLRQYPDAAFAAEARAALARSFQDDRVAAEIAYVAPEYRAGFERPYGAAWLLQLMAELRAFDDPQARGWLATLLPLEQAYVAALSDWLGKLAYPIRIGEHAQTAFAFALFLDWAGAAGNDEFAQLVRDKSTAFHGGDRDCPLAYEPGGQDFLSPCLAEADLMRRVLAPDAYAAWLRDFLPGIPAGEAVEWLPLARITDRSDGKLAHLDGLHLSRAWALHGMAVGLPADDPRRAALETESVRQGHAGLAAVTGEHYEGGHWLGSFATYLVTATGTPGHSWPGTAGPEPREGQPGAQ